MKTAPRSLTFERLEQKLSPTAVLLVVTAVEDDQQIALEGCLHERPAHANSGWRMEHDNTRLLQFVQQETRCPTDDPWTVPSAQQCRAADDWLRLEELDARTLVICTTLQGTQISP